MSHFASAGPDPALQALRDAPHWFAVKTRARSEKKVARLLAEQDIEVYCPVRQEERQWADRKKRVEFPLFSGYVFSRISLNDQITLLRTPGVVHLVQEQGRPVPIREEELDAIRRFERGIGETGQEPEPVDWLEPGEEVVVTDGPFKGMRGVLLEVRGRTRVAVKIGALKAAVAVEMGRGFVEAVGG